MGDRRDKRVRLDRSIVIGVLCAAAAFAALPCVAESIPAWLDDAITSWNQKNPLLIFQFVSIKDSFVWYRVQDTPEIGSKEIRGAAYRLAQENRYKTTDEEELVTTGKPPVADGPTVQRKCWRRSFVRNIEGSDGTTAVGGERAGVQQRLLTTMVCDEGSTWATGFRISN